MCTVGGRIGWIGTRCGTARRPGIAGPTTPSTLAIIRTAPVSIHLTLRYQLHTTQGTVIVLMDASQYTPSQHSINVICTMPHSCISRESSKLLLHWWFLATSFPNCDIILIGNLLVLAIPLRPRPLLNRPSYKAASLKDTFKGKKSSRRSTWSSRNHQAMIYSSSKNRKLISITWRSIRQWLRWSLDNR